MPYDLIIANGTIATASDAFSCNVGIADGRIVALGHGLGAAARLIDAAGRLVLPGGIDRSSPASPPVSKATLND